MLLLGDFVCVRVCFLHVCICVIALDNNIQALRAKITSCMPDRCVKIGNRLFLITHENIFSLLPTITQYSANMAVNIPTRLLIYSGEEE